MSDIYFSSVGSQTHRYSHRDVSSSSRGIGQNWYPRDSIEWTPEISLDLLSFFTRIEYPFRSVFEIPFKEPLRSEIRRFLISLDAYIESPNPVIPYRDILYGSTLKDYSKTLKRIKRKSFETTWMVSHFEYPDWWNDVPSYKIKDIGDIFNYSYLIFWKGDSEDYKFGFNPVHIDEEYLDLFKEAVYSLLPEDSSFNKVDPIEILSQMSSSMSLDSDFKHKPHFKIKNKYLHFSKKRGICDRSVISVSPENYRDTVINNPSDLNTISMIDKQLLEILRVMPGHIHLSDKDVVTKRLHSLRKKCCYFIQRDLKKEGITKPRELLKAMMEVLHSKYPEITIFSYTDFFDTYILRVGEELVYPDRGHGLGMANALTTLMQLAIHKMILNESINYISDMYSKVLCINDDFVAGFTDADHVFEYWNIEDDIMDKLSIMREPTKSFTSDWCFVLAERYFIAGTEYEKTSYQLRELLLPLSCFNVTHAKEYFISAQTYCSSKYALRYLDEIRDYWGYEFYPTEFNYPHVVGGWINERINSVDMSLVLLEELELKSYHFRGFNATRVTARKRYKGNLVKSPKYILFGEPDIPEEYHEHFDLLPAKSLEEKYGKLLSHSRASFSNYWNRLYKKRQKVFKIPSEFPYLDLLEKIKKSRPTTQFYPNDSMIACYHSCNVRQGKIKEIYLDPNPHMALVSYYNETSYPFKERFSICFSNPDSTTKKTSSLFSKEIQRSLKSDEIAVLSTGKFHEVYYPSDGFKPEEQYLTPIKIGEVTSIINWGKGYPEVYERFEDDLIEEKRKIYGRLFSFEELVLINQYNLSRDHIRLVEYFSKNSGLDFKNSLEYISDNMPQREEKYFVAEQDSDEEDTDFHLTDERELEEGIIGRVTFRDLFIEGCPILWNVRHDWESYQYDSEQTLKYLNDLDNLIVIATFPGLYTPQKRVLEYERIRSGKDPILSHLIESSGVGRLLTDPTSAEAEDAYDAFDLFGDGD